MWTAEPAAVFVTKETVNVIPQGGQPQSPHARIGALQLFLVYYNHARPHQSLGGQSPVTRRNDYFAQARA